MMQQATSVLADRYELGPPLGEGGMARVVRATDRTLHRDVAVKILAPPYDRDRGYVERFEREAMAAARLNHPNIVTVFDSGEEGGTPFIVMELVEGETLSARLRRRGPLAPEDVVAIGGSIAAALVEAHARGVVHRDVKPGNVMLTNDDRVKVLDFGIARASGAEAVTRTGLVLGSASYLSPEQAQGSSGDERTDIYALGCVLYQMVTGRPPFVADDPVAALYQHVNEPVRPPSALRAVPPALEAVILRCLEKDPAERFASAADVEAALAAASLEGSTTVPLPIAVEPETERIDRRPPAPPSDRGGPMARGDSSHRERPRWVLPTLVGALALVVVIALVAIADPFGGNGRASAGSSRREPTDAGGRLLANADPAPDAVSDRDVADAYSAVLVTIAGARTAGDLDGATAGALVADAEDAVARFGAGDTAAVDRSVGAYASTVAQALQAGTVPAATSAALGEAMDRLVAAMAISISTGPSGVSPPEPGHTEPGPKHDHTDGGHGHGPPDHANGNAYGNDGGDED